MKLLWITSIVPDQPETELLSALQGFSVHVARGGLDGVGQLRSSKFDVVVVNLPVPQWTGEEILEELQRANPLVPVLIREPQADVAAAVRMTKLGAYHFLDMSADYEDVRQALLAAVEYRRSRELSLFGASVAASPWRKVLVGTSQAMQQVAQIVQLVGSRRCTVLITGETGTGKELVARALHLAGDRSQLPLVAVNCSALPENLLETELFGHVKGAFTGAIQQRVGRFEQAHRSTLFLDEVGDMPLELQAKLLRVLQEREFQRVGSSETVRVDVRVIAASNVDLTERVRQGRFREDLYYRLNVVPIPVPPLRDRLSDIPPLVHHFLEKICRQEGLSLKVVTEETLERLASYSWPGNVRQLENAVEMAVALSGDRAILYPADFPLPSALPAKRTTGNLALTSIPVPDDGLDFEATVSRIERDLLEQALRKTNGNKKMAADMLRMKRTTLSAKLKSLEAVAV